MNFEFSNRSRERMKGLHPDIVAVMELALKRSPVDFTILEGMRTLERQKELVARGSSWTMNSRHLTGHAIDVAPLDNGEVSWDWPLYHKLAPVIKAAADELGVDLEWGGDWRNKKDGPHWQLSWDSYGKSDMSPRASLDRELSGQVAARQHRIDVPEAVLDVIADADKGMSESSTVWATVRQWAGTAMLGAGAWWSQQPEGTQQAIIIAGAIIVAGFLLSLEGGVKTLRERFRKAEIGRNAKALLNL